MELWKELKSNYEDKHCFPAFRRFGYKYRNKNNKNHEREEKTFSEYHRTVKHFRVVFM